MRERNDCFVGNLGFDATESQLYEVFSKVGPVKKVRLQTEKDSGKSKGFAFVEYDDPAIALSAMRSLNGYELNGRKIRVDFTNTSNLKEVARALGHEVPEVAGVFIPDSFESSESSSMGPSVKDVISRLKLHDAYDLLAAMKAYIDEDRGVRAKVLFKEFPQLTTAFSEIQLRLGMGLGVTAADLNLVTASGDPLPDQQVQYAQYQPQQRDPPPIAPGFYPPHHDPYLHMAPDHYNHAFPPYSAPPVPMPFGGPNEQDLLFQQVMQMTDFDLMQMPEHDRMQMIALKQHIAMSSQYMGGPPHGNMRY